MITRKKRKKKFVITDIHGAYKALKQCLERSNFDYHNDILILLGDIVDGYDEVFECLEELLKIKNLISVAGNHDVWFDEFVRTDFHPMFWNYGGQGTILSYLRHMDGKGICLPTRSGFKTSLNGSDIPLSHRQFFQNQQLYHIDSENRCFVHAGFKRNIPFLEQEKKEYYWNRDLWTDAMSYKFSGLTSEEFEMSTKFAEIYIGHSPTTHWDSDKPLTVFNIMNLDTGAAHSGRLTIMDIDSKKYWQSDPVRELYPENYRD
ncbi:metallophosphoesterase [Olivibacter domesticus]|uniref:Serine/threonine protein phosphatase 1 n=1 Tax=Olivibacter domesticus TaxID=407022 RepID=A0A1H7I6H6_OLID1|nr:metallophosphoesterase [Olivibacter domesticus]SEK58173.1 serine/threonine protein phosphatase 1 [Olivibacter domesticus]